MKHIHQMRTNLRSFETKNADSSINKLKWRVLRTTLGLPTEKMLSLYKICGAAYQHPNVKERRHKWWKRKGRRAGVR